nr:hypothetical protein [Tanacetum cinerariifolium]
MGTSTVGKQHKASCKTKLMHSVTNPLHTLHMDLFGPTSVSSLNHKWYCLVVTGDISRFTWTFFLKTKDETSGILRNFIIKIENLKELKVKIIRCDNKGEFRNKEMNDFCSRKGIKREFGNAKTSQQNGVAEKRNRTLIEAARTMVLVNKFQNKTTYELLNGRIPAIGFLKSFGCHVMILNTLDNLGKFDAKGDEGYFIGYSMSSKAFRVFNKRTKRVEKNLHVDFLENKLIKKGAGPNWLFDIDTLTNSMNYVPVVVAGTSSTNFSGTKDVESQDVKKDVGNSNPTATSKHPSADHMETLIVETPIPTDLEFPARVYKVEKPMYGLHQAPRAWYGALSKYWLTNGFQRVLQKKDGIFLSQDKYVGDILKKFGYSDVRSANTPMNKENPWGKDGTGNDVDLHLYRSMIGSLMYLITSKLDIMFAVCAYAMNQVTPKECHLHTVKRIFRYLKGHPKLGIWYPKDSLFDLVAYSDSDYGGATQDRKSTTRGCQFFGRRLIS